MDLALLTPQTIKLKGKRVQLVIDPTELLKTKTEADGVIAFFHPKDITTSKIEGNRVIMSGPGEYEVSGAKIGGVKVGSRVVYSFTIDKTKILLFPATEALGIKEMLDDYHIAVIRVDLDDDIESVLASGVKIVSLYGLKAKAVFDKLAKDMEKEQTSTTGKLSVVAEKLPEKTQLVLLN